MKHCYFLIDDNRIAVVDVITADQIGRANNRHLITRVNVPEQIRRRGHASRLLQQVCSAADRERAELELWVSPYPGTDESRLVSLYQRYGFAFTDEPGVMLRPPSCD